MERKLKDLQKSGVMLCAVPISSIIGQLDSEAKISAGGAPALASAASGKAIAAAVTAIVVGTTSAMFYFGRERGQLRGDERLPDSFVVEGIDDSSIVTTSWTTTTTIPETTQETSENTGRVTTTARTTTTAASAVPAGTVPVQTTQPKNDVYVPDVNDDNNGGEEIIQQEEQWEDVDFGSYNSDGVYYGIKPYCFDEDTGNITTITSIRREPTYGTLEINYTTSKSDNNNYKLIALILNTESGESYDYTEITPVSTEHNGNNHVSVYHHDVIKNDLYSYQWSTSTGCDYADDNGAYNRSIYDINAYCQNFYLGSSGKLVISKNTCEIDYHNSFHEGCDTSYTFVFFSDYVNSFKEYGHASGYQNYFLFYDMPEINEITVEKGSKYFEIYDGILYFKKDGYRWLLWTTERSPSHLIFPDNVIAYNEKELEKIHLSDYNDIDFGNNIWLKNDDLFLDFLDVTIPEDW